MPAPAAVAPKCVPMLGRQRLHLSKQPWWLLAEAAVNPDSAEPRQLLPAVLVEC
jgi:hypothetical protein